MKRMATGGSYLLMSSTMLVIVVLRTFQRLNGIIWTMQGAIQSGEGVVGLSRAFFVAGVPTQIASQWSVDDAATVRLMTDLYRNLKAGKPKSESLRQAGLKMLQDKQHPYYWAPFILLGDWRK